MNLEPFFSIAFSCWVGLGESFNPTASVNLTCTGNGILSAKPLSIKGGERGRGIEKVFFYF